MMRQIPVYLELGRKRAFAGALDWPGWCRHGVDEADALDALFTHGTKYAAVLADTALGFVAPQDAAQLVVVERLTGTATTDFGAPAVAPSTDGERTCEPADVRRFETILQAAWRAFDGMVQSARGRPLAKGPRGGGRSLDAIVQHVVEADRGYLGAVGWKAPKMPPADDALPVVRRAVLEALTASAAGRIAPRGPRGGQRWTARYFVRRVAWHVIAHTWEIERRVAAGEAR